MDRFPPKFIIKVGMKANFGNKKRVDFGKPGGRPPSVHKSCILSGVNVKNIRVNSNL